MVIQTDYSMRQNMQNDHTKSHVTKPTSEKQIAPTTVGPNNVQYHNRAQGSGSGSSYHATGTTNMVKSIAVFTSNQIADKNYNSNFDVI